MKYNLLTTFRGVRCSRTNEYVECLSRNIDNPYIGKIVVFLDTNNVAYKIKKLLSHVEVISCKGHPTYGAMFEVANSETGRVIIANGDIYFDKTLRLLSLYDLENVFIHLTRRECNQSQNPNFFKNKIGAGDAWIFETPIKVFAKGIHMGSDFCDQVLAHLACEIGYDLHNPASEINAWHLHANRDGPHLKKYRAEMRNGLRKDFPWIGKKQVTAVLSKLEFLPKLKKPL